MSPGDLLGSRYEILSVLGYGGMGVVYRALDRKLDLEIALKRLRPDRISSEKREALRREIILSRKVTHENVCRIYDLEEIDGVEYVSMEYIRGKQLKEIEESDGVLPIGRGLTIAKGICRGLAAAHRIGVLHRDLKPENVIVEEDGRPRLMDFGIAIDQSRNWEEKRGSVPGTPQFLSPELLRGAAANVRSDIYALGVLLFEMFTGQVPFDDPETAALIRKILRDDPPEISHLRPDFPPELAAVLNRAIAKDPAARFAGADDLAAAIEAYEGAFLDKVLGEVSVARAKSLKLVVILEANKAIASTFDPREILEIILKTATEETDAERGTIFLVDPDSRMLVSQILEGGTVDPIRLPWGHGIAGACAAEGRPILTVDVTSDPRHEPGPDSTSGFRTVSILAAPMKTSGGEVVGVIEVLNKRRGAFSPEDEEFLVSVADHAAIAVLNARQHRRAVDEARREAETRVLRSLHSLLAPSRWPETPGFESAPLRWRGEVEMFPLGFDVSASEDRILVCSGEDGREHGAGLVDLVRALGIARSAADRDELARLLEGIERPPESLTVVRFRGADLEMASVGAPLPYLYRDGRPLPFAGQEGGRIHHARVRLAPGDLLFLASRAAREMSPDEMARAARLAEKSALPEAFTDLVSSWKYEGKTPARRDALVLGFRRL